MKEYKKMYVVNGINIPESDFDVIIDSFMDLGRSLNDKYPSEREIIRVNDITQIVDKFEVYIETYYFSYFGKLIEIGQKIMSKKI